MNFLSLAECCEIVSGATPKTSVAEYWDGDVEWATPADLSKLQGALIEETPRKITNQGLTSCAATVLPAGSVLLSSRAPIGHVAINTKPMATNQGFKSLIPRPDLLDAKYLFHWLRANRTHLQSLGNGATFKELSKATVARVRLPVPPLAEQRRIAVILDQADALRAKRRHALAHLDELPLAIFMEMFGSPDDAVDRVPFGEVARLLGGRNLVADDAGLQSPYRVLKISAVTTGQFKPHESKPLPADYVPPESHLVRRGDLLMSRANTTELVGAVALVHDAPENLALPDKVWKFDWRVPDSVPAFYHALFRTPSVRHHVSRLSSGTGGSMKNVSKGKLETLLIPDVPPAQQRQFAKRVDRVNSQRAAGRRAILAEEELFASLQFEAFRGNL